MPETILDNSSIDGLLRIAGEEGLLEDRDDHGDKLLYSLNKRPLSEWHRQQILEQVVINSKLYSAREIPFDWLKGDFLDMNLIEQAGNVVENKDEIKQVAPEIIEGMLIARGQNSNLNKWLKLLKKGVTILDEIEKYERDNPGIKVENPGDIIRGMIDDEFSKSEQYRLASRMNKVIIDTIPIRSVLEELLKLSNIASVNQYQLRVPIYRPSANLINLHSNKQIDGTATHIYRITSKELGFFPICTSLRDALTLKDNKTTIALREKIDAWVNSFENSSVDLTTSIQKEIQKAGDSLIKSNKMKKAGYVTGLISIPFSAIGIVNPFLGALGLTLTCLAVIFEKSGVNIERSVQWVGFGSR